MIGFQEGRPEMTAFLLWKEMLYGKTDLQQPLHP